MSMLAHSRRSFSFQGRSFLAFVLKPSAPLNNWLIELEEWESKSPDFFSRKPIVLDLSAISLTRPDFSELLMLLRARKYRLISVESINPEWLEPGLEPLFGDKPFQELQTALNKNLEDTSETRPNEPKETKSEELVEKSLMLDSPVRSGQSVFFPTGDVTVTGSVASGSEIIAGGSIHIYGALRGRVFAGSYGNAKARIFCKKFEAELLVIGGYYKSSEDIDQDLYGQPVQAWLEDKMIKLKVME